MSDPENIEFDTDKIDEAGLGLLWRTAFKQSKHDELFRAWKGMDYDVLDRLHERGLILDPANKYKSVIFTPEGEKLARETFRKLFGKE